MVPAFESFWHWLSWFVIVVVVCGTILARKEDQ